MNSNEHLEDRLNALVEAGSFFIFRMNPDWSEMIALDGRDQLATISRPTTDWLDQFIPVEDQQWLLDIVRNHCREATSLERDHQIRRRDGTIGWVRTRAAPIKGIDGSIVEWFGTMSDITELKDEEARQRFLLSWSDRINRLATPQCVMQASAELLGELLQVGRVRYVEMDESSIAYSRSAEWVNHALGVRPIEGRFTLAQFNSALIRKVEAGKTLVTPNVWEDEQTKSQAELFDANQVRAGILVPLIKDGKLSGALSIHMPTVRQWRPLEVRIVEEIAERTWSAVHRAKAEAKLREATASMQMALDVAELIPWQLLLPERLLVPSTGFREVLGVSGTDPIPYHNLLSFVHPDDQERRQQAVDRAIDEKGTFDIEYRILVEGKLRWVRAMGRYDSSEIFERLVGVSQDITERKRGEEQQRLDAERLKLIFDSAYDYAIVALDVEGHITSWNSGAERILGYHEDEAVGFSASILYTPEDIIEGVLEREMKMAALNGRADNERWQVRKDGSRFWASGLTVPLQNGHQHGYLNIFRDLTDKRRSEESLALLVDELNHRVKNTLATVQSICRQSLRNASVPDEVQATIANRLGALASSHDLLTREHWAGAGMDEVVMTVLAPFLGTVVSDQVSASGPPVLLTPKAAVALSIALHELGSNAVRHGSLAARNGTLTIRWYIQSDILNLDWVERGSAMTERKRRGFGSRMIEEALVYELQAEASLKFQEGGVCCSLRIPLEGNVR